MLFGKRQWQSAAVALFIGLTFPFAWIVGTGDARVSDRHTIERSVAERMAPSEYEAFMSQYARPMTFGERINSAGYIIRQEWKGYLGVSATVALFVFIINGLVWKATKKP